MDSDIFYGAIVIFFKRVSGEILYLVVENSKSGNITFVSGAQEGNESLLETAKREVEEELGIGSGLYTLAETDVWHNFIFDEHKKDRAGAKGSYQAFVGGLTGMENITPTKELKRIWWKTESEVLSLLSFPDLAEVFKNVLAKELVK